MTDSSKGKQLKDKLITEARAYLRDRQLAMEDDTISEKERTKRLQAARERYETETAKIREKIAEMVTDTRKSKAATTKTVTIENETYTELRSELDDGDPTDVTLGLIARGTPEIVAALATQKGQQLVEKALRKHGTEESTIKVMLDHVTTAASKRSEQHASHLQPTNVEQKTMDKDTAFWHVALSTFIDDVTDAVDQQKRVVVFPSEPTSNDQPEQIELAKA